MKNWKDYKRFPIILGQHDCIVVHLFERTDYIEDFWMSDVESKMYDDIDLYKRSAEQFIDQLEGSYCDAFLHELIKACQSKLKNK